MRGLLRGLEGGLRCGVMRSHSGRRGGFGRGVLDACWLNRRKRSGVRVVEDCGRDLSLAMVVHQATAPMSMCHGERAD